MMYAPYVNAQRGDKPRILGAVQEAEVRNWFEYFERSHDDRAVFAPDYPHRIFCGPRQETRCARVLNTVLYLIIDETETGEPVQQKWRLSNHRFYKGVAS